MGRNLFVISFNFDKCFIKHCVTVWPDHNILRIMTSISLSTYCCQLKRSTPDKNAWAILEEFSFLKAGGGGGEGGGKVTWGHLLSQKKEGHNYSL